MATEMLLKARIPGNIVLRDDCYVATCPKLGLVVYGKTHDDADKRMGLAIDIWFTRLSAKRLLINRLNTWGVPYEVVPVRAQRVYKSRTSHSWNTNSSVPVGESC